MKIALILAAGASTRMGTCKAALPWIGETTLLTYQVRQWLAVGVSPLVVLAPHNTLLGEQLPWGSRVVINPHPEAGKTGSMLTGLGAIAPNWETLVMTAVDQPRPTWIYQQLLQKHTPESHPITAPTYQDRLGHPLLFDRVMLPHLQAMREETLGLRQVVQQFATQIQRVAFTTSLVLSDLNTPATYQQCLQDFSGVAE